MCGVLGVCGKTGSFVLFGAWEKTRLSGFGVCDVCGLMSRIRIIQVLRESRA